MNLRLDIRLSIILVLFKNKYTQKDITKHGGILAEDHLDMITEVDKYFQSKSVELLHRLYVHIFTPVFNV